MVDAVRRKYKSVFCIIFHAKIEFVIAYVSSLSGTGFAGQRGFGCNDANRAFATEKQKS
ncbi:MAG TPA: hypothetical protein VMD27_01670 [Candidatus Aquilonibacter sp.]|nr:hypothetical protein [Candidatus Aquilonibacter sp.]